MKIKLKRFWKYRELTLMALPAMIYFLINNYIPLPGNVLAFKRMDFKLGIYKSPWVGLDNFKYMFATRDASIMIRNTVLYNSVFIVTGTLGAIFVAILLNELTSKKLTKFYQSAMLLPALISMTVVGYIVYAFLSPTYGYLNQFLEFLGKDTINAYITPKPWPYVLVIVEFWKNVGYSSVVYLATIVGFDHSLYEAAEVDGANRWAKIRDITLPVLKPTIISLTLLKIGKIFHAEFGLFYQVPLASSLTTETTEVLSTYTYKALMMQGDLSKSAAAGLLESIVGFVLVLVTNYIVRKTSEENSLF